MKMINTTKEKIHQKQQEFFKNKSRNRWIFGGNRTGKTWAGAFEAVKWATSKTGTDGWVVSLSTQVQRDVAQRKILEILGSQGLKLGIDFDCVMLKGKSDAPERGVIDFISILANKSRIGFKNCEQGREKFQGTGLDWVWFDEEPPEDVYEECLMRTLDRGGYVWGTMTPLKGRTWVYHRIFMNLSNEIWTANWEWSDNPYLCKKEIKRMEGNYSSDTLESRRYGRFMEGTGLVFTEFGEENIKKNVSVSSQKNTWVYTGISIDPGYTNPTAVLWFGIDGDSNIFVIDEYKESHQSVEQIAQSIHEKTKNLGLVVQNVFIDSAATAQTLGEPRSVADQFRACGVPVDTRVDKNVLDGIHAVKGLFRSADGTRKLFVFEHCIHLVKELRGYFWGDRDKPVKKDDHCIDALRYFVMANHEKSLKPKQHEIQTSSTAKKFEKHKRKIINEKI